MLTTTARQRAAYLRMLATMPATTAPRQLRRMRANRTARRITGGY